MRVVGILGGVASGKSFVAREFERLGAYVFDADQAGRLVLTEPEIIRELMEKFGPEILDSSLQIDRKAVAKLVFGDRQEAKSNLEFLEQITHPRITAKLEAELEQIRASGLRQIFILDAAVLDKASWRKYCTDLVFVDSPKETRLQRALSRGWSEADFRSRESSQPSLALKQSLCAAKIINNGSEEDVRRQVASLWAQWTQRAQSTHGSAI